MRPRQRKACARGPLYERDFRIDDWDWLAANNQMLMTNC